MVVLAFRNFGEMGFGLLEKVVTLSALERKGEVVVVWTVGGLMIARGIRFLESLALDFFFFFLDLETSSTPFLLQISGLCISSSISSSSSISTSWFSITFSIFLVLRCLFLALFLWRD